MGATNRYRGRAAGLVLAVMLAGAVGERAAGSSLQQPAEALYADDASVRSRAAQQLIAAGQASVRVIDPFESPCFSSERPPASCRNFDHAFASTISILHTVAAKTGSDKANPAKELLWQIVHSPSRDFFDELGRRAEWKRTDGGALRARATQALDALLTVPADLGEKAASRLAVAHARRAGRSWHLLRNCSGTAMVAGCNYGSYLFSGDGQRISFRLIRYDARDNFGAGMTLRLSFVDAEGRIGLARAAGGFGGDLLSLTFYRLGEEQAALCSLSASGDDARRLLEKWQRYVAVAPAGCRAVATDDRVAVRLLSQ
jgi:hypothetical protein